MAKKKSSKNPQPPKPLRERAEQMLRTSPTDVSRMAAEDVQRLIHELQVHQIELELQNEELREAQLHLAESRDRYSDLYEFAPVGYVTLNKEGKILEANLTAATMLDAERQALVQANLANFVTRESADACYLHLQDVFASRPTRTSSKTEPAAAKQTCEVEVKQANGSMLAVRLESIGFGPASDRHCLTALLDISVRKLAEEALRKLNIDLGQSLTDRTTELQTSIDELKLLNEAVANLGEGVVITDDELDWPGPRIRFVNNALCRITGYSADELIGKTPRVLQGKATDRAALDDLKAELSASRSCRVEVTNYRKDGTPYNAELFVTPLFDAAGRRTNFISIHRDITERKRAEQTLRESENRIRSILDTAADGIITIDQGGLITSMNHAAERMFGYTSQELAGQNIRVLMPSPYRDEHDDYLARYLATRRPRIIGCGREVRGQRKDRSTFPLDLAVSEVENVGFTGILRDITERKELERQLVEIAADERRRIGQELHDGIGQELTGLSLTAGTIRELLQRCEWPSSANAAGSPDADAMFQQACATVDRMRENLNATSRHVQSLSRGILPVPIDSEGLRAALDELAASIHKPEEIVCRLDCPATIKVSDNDLATHLFRIAQEAAHNAVKHAHARLIRITLRVDDGTLTLEVSDNGIGLTPPSSSATNSSGAGLRIMQHRASLIGATLHVEPAAEGGTVVRCCLPLTNHT